MEKSKAMRNCQLDFNSFELHGDEVREELLKFKHLSLESEELKNKENVEEIECENDKINPNVTSEGHSLNIHIEGNDIINKRHSVNESTQTKTSNLSFQLQSMKAKLNLSFDSPTRRNRSLNNSQISSDIPSDLENSLDDTSEKTPESGFDEFYRYFRNEEIKKELQLVRTNHQEGVHVVPSYKSLQMWFGVIFIRDGPYNEGIFHLTIYFPDDYPQQRPVFRFTSKIFHPQIEPKKGTLNLNRVYSRQSINRVRVWELIKYARSCFYHLNVCDVSNTKAALLLESNFETFIARCRSSVLDSLLEFEERKYATEHELDNPFKSQILNDELLKMIKKILVTKSYQGNRKMDYTDGQKIS